jgi:streptomycin 6-kinase
MRRIIRRRADQFAEELALDRQRVYTCAAVYAVISSAWSLEEGYGPERTAKRRAVMQELGAF